MDWKCLRTASDAGSGTETPRAPEDPRGLLFDRGDYEGAVQLLRPVVQNDPENGEAFTLLALALERLCRGGEAFAAIDRALELRPRELINYYILAQLFLRGGAWDDARAVLDYLGQQGVPEDAFSLWFQGQLAELAEEAPEKALGLYRAAAAEVEAGACLTWASSLYYRMAVLSLDASDPQESLDLLDQGLVHNLFDEDCLSCAAWLLQKSGRAEEAIELFRALEELPNHPAVVEHHLARLYDQNLQRWAPEALAQYQTLIGSNPRGEYFFRGGWCALAMGDHEGAQELFRREIEFDPGDVDGYNGLAGVLKACSRWEEALAQVDRALEVMKEQGECYPSLYAHRVQLLRRLNRWEDALEAAEEAGQDDRFQLQFDICVQFGRWENAEAVLDRWSRQQGESPEWMLAHGRLCQYRGEPEQAGRIMAKAELLLPQEDVQDFRIAQAGLMGDTAALAELWRDQREAHPDSSYYRLHLAFTLWQAGQKQEAEAAALQALERTDRELQGYLTVEALYRARRVLALALLGRTAEAEAELARVRELPLCEHCEYCACKDADLFEAMAEEVCGSRSRALELYRRGAEHWPDEMDFRAGILRLEPGSSDQG